MAQLDWTPAMSQDSAMSPGCLANVNAWGGVYCSAGLCAFVPGTGAPTNSTWDQRLPNITFSSTAYGATGTTLTLSEMTIPDDLNDVYSGSEVVTATAVHVACGVAAALSCDEQCSGMCSDAGPSRSRFGPWVTVGRVRAPGRSATSARSRGRWCSAAHRPGTG